MPARPQDTRRSFTRVSDLLTSAADVSGRPTLRTASRGDFIVPRTNRKFGDSILRRSSSSMEYTVTRPQTAAFETDFQAPSQDIFIHCSLLSSDKQTFMDYVMRRRSTCRRRIRNVVVTVTVTVITFIVPGSTSGNSGFHAFGAI